MKKKIKYIMSGVLIGVVISSTIPVIAKSTQEMINVTYKNIKVCVDGKEIDTAGSEPFIYNGTTYLPIRKVGEAFGKAATWNGNTNTVYLGSQPGNESCIFDIMQPYASNGYTQYSGNDTFEVAGSERKNGFHLDGNFLTGANGYVTFNVEEKYSILSFECVSESGIDTSGKVKVYADNILVQEIDANSSNGPKKVNIPLNGVLQVKIEGYKIDFWNVKLY